MKIVTTRKTHYCVNPECKGLIEKGQKAKVWLEKVTRVDGSGTYFETYYFHMNCKIILPGEVY